MCGCVCVGVCVCVCEQLDEFGSVTFDHSKGWPTDVCVCVCEQLDEFGSVTFDHSKGWLTDVCVCVCVCVHGCPFLCTVVHCCRLSFLGNFPAGCFGPFFRGSQPWWLHCSDTLWSHQRNSLCGGGAMVC